MNLNVNTELSSMRENVNIENENLKAALKEALEQN